jgi:hypothetical protein
MQDYKSKWKKLTLIERIDEQTKYFNYINTQVSLISTVDSLIEYIFEVEKLSREIHVLFLWLHAVFSFSPVPLTGHGHKSLLLSPSNSTLTERIDR